jgi:hypothetical protein
MAARDVAVRSACAFSLVLASASPARSQQQAHRTTATITGVVYDSLVRNAPLSGAEVTVDGTDLSAVSDAKGRFTLRGVLPGRAGVRFYHTMLDSLGFGAAPVAVAVADTGVVSVRLTTPSPATLRASLCLGPQPSATGVVLGRVRNVDTQAPLPHATVTASWAEWSIAKAGMTRAERRVAGEATPSGAFAVCGVPNDVAVVVRATAAGHVTGLVDVNLSQRLFAVHDFGVSVTDSGATVGELARLDSAFTRGDSAHAQGAATIVGVIRDANGKILDQAQVAVSGFPISVRTRSDGAYTLTRVPAGTQTLDVRSLGFAPKRMGVELRTGERRVLDVILDGANAQELAPVSVVARNMKLDKTGFDGRRKSGMGQYITEEEIERRGVFETTQALWNARGTRVVWNGYDNVVMFTRPTGTGRGTLVDQGKGVMQGGGYNTLCRPAYWVDGLAMPVPVPGDPFDDTNASVRPRDIRGIEVYLDPSSVPPQYRRPDVACGVVLIWTKPRQPKQLKPSAP